ncbi:MAG: hypothetical protein V7641_3674 [Blastocatellia bacterium]
MSRDFRGFFIACDRLACTILLLLAGATSLFAQSAVEAGQKPSPATDELKGAKKKIVHEGIAVEFELEPLDAQKKKSGIVEEGDLAAFRFTITDTASGTPLTGLRPAVWMDMRRHNEAGDCSKKITAFLGGSLLARPQLDFSAYYVLALNSDATISVVDPLFHYGGTKLLALVALKSNGEDWTLTADQAKLFVSLPDANQVAVVDSLAWKVFASLDVEGHPTRLAMQPDEQYLWVAYGASEKDRASSGVAVVTTAGLKVVARIPTGRGRHEIAFSDDSRLAFVTNQDDGTVSVISIRELKKIKEIAVGRKPVAIAYSDKARAVYVVNQEEGTIITIDAAEYKVLSTIKAQPGLGQIRFAPGGRLGFVANPENDLVYILDTAVNRIIQVAHIKGKPEQLTFSNSLAYVRTRDSEFVYMIPLDELGKEGQAVPTLDFPGGRSPLGKMSRPSLADTMIRLPEPSAVLVANPMDQTIYYYKEGMAAPMGNFSNYKREPRAVLVVDRGLKERAPGVYEATAQLPGAGIQDVAFFLDSPRIAHCFGLLVNENPKLAELRKVGKVTIETLITDSDVQAGQHVRVRFKIADVETREKKRGLSDLGALVFLAPGIWQTRLPAKETDEGVYEIAFVPPQAGIYYVYLESPALGLTFKDGQRLTFRAQDTK